MAAVKRVYPYYVTYNTSKGFIETQAQVTSDYKIPTGYGGTTSSSFIVLDGSIDLTKFSKIVITARIDTSGVLTYENYRIQDMLFPINRTDVNSQHAGPSEYIGDNNGNTIVMTCDISSITGTRFIIFNQRTLSTGYREYLFLTMIELIP